MYGVVRVGVALLVCSSLCGCALSNTPYALGYRRIFLRGVPQGDDSFSRGWRDGCDTSLATVGAGLLRWVPEKIPSEQLVNDLSYRKGYSRGSNYCTAFLDWDVSLHPIP
jgi:hypothetical protein